MLRRISVNELRVGMYVVDTGLSWLEHPYLYSVEGEIATESERMSICHEGYKVAFVETCNGRYRFSDIDHIQFQQEFEKEIERIVTPEDIRITSFDEEMEHARRIHADAVAFAHHFHHCVHGKKTIDIEGSKRLLRDLVLSVIRNRDALIALIKTLAEEEYTYRHSVNVVVLATAFGSFLDMPSFMLEELGMAALFHDIGKISVPRAILNKPGKLTEEEFEIIKEHPLESFRMLKELPGMSENITRGVLQHHEKYNGGGYPYALAGDDISLFARIISLADVYDALTSERVYKKSILPHKALCLIYNMRDVDYHPGMSERFIKCIGIYPPGSMVLLSNGDMGLVCGTHADMPLSPRVKVILNDQMMFVAPSIVDLALENDLTILSCLDPADYKIDPHAYLVETDTIANDNVA